MLREIRTLGLFCLEDAIQKTIVRYWVRQEIEDGLLKDWIGVCDP